MKPEPKTIDVETTNTEPKQALAKRENGAAMQAAAPPPAAPIVTAAQAKIEAVAAITMAAYERAATLALTPQEIEALQEPFPDEAFKPGAAGKEHLIYIEHAFLRDRLNQVIGMGQWALIPRSRWAEDFVSSRSGPASRVYVEAMLVVRGCYVAESIGEMEYYKNNQAINFGDAVEGAKTAALRRCCKDFGIGLQAWKKDFGEGWWQRKREREAAAKQAAKRTAPAQKAAPAQTAPPPQQAPPQQPPPQQPPEQQPPPQQTPPPQQQPPPQQEPPPQAPPAKQPTQNGKIETYQPVTVLDVIEKTGHRSDTGAQWRAYLCKFSDGYNELQAGTFNRSVGEMAKQLVETQAECRLTVKPGRKPDTIEIVELAELAPAEQEPDADHDSDQDLPFDK